MWQAEEVINARQAAFETLYKICYDHAYSNIAVDHALSGLKEGKAFAARLVYGVLERQITLDFLIDQYCSKPKPKLRIILRMGTYQLYFMNKVSSAAAVDESVKLAKANGLTYYSSFINAVLHKIDANRINLECLSDLSVRYSVPQNLINMWIKAYGKDQVLHFLPALNGRPPVFAVANANLTDAETLCGILNKEGTDCSVFNGLVKINASADLTALTAFKSGLFHIQDISCVTALKALDIHDGDTVFDFCAAPGGKSFTASYLCGKNGTVNSFDLHESRVHLIQNSSERLSLKNVKARVNDASLFCAGLGTADKIICDVPCSGFGIIRRKPEIRYKDLDCVKGLAEIQFNILNTSSKYLKPKGRLLYSTCTLNKKENENVVTEFLQCNPEFSLLEMKTIFPGENEGDGFFYSIIERN